MGFQCELSREGYTTHDGQTVIYWHLTEPKPSTLNIQEIDRVLSGRLVFGNRRQIEALKFWAVIEEYKELEREFYNRM